MLQSIFKVHWNGLLGPLKDMLKWSRISKDVRGCYYQASKLVTLANRSFKALLIMEFLTEHADRVSAYAESDMLPANAVCELVKLYETWLSRLLYCKDEHHQMIANFIIMSQDFIDFVDSFRRQDSIGIEDGYHCFAPVWKMLGQTKYLQSYIEQLVMNHNDFPFHRRMTQLINRTVRTYNASTGKSALAQDEFLEICTESVRELYPNKYIH